MGILVIISSMLFWSDPGLACPAAPKLISFSETTYDGHAKVGVNASCTVGVNIKDSKFDRSLVREGDKLCWNIYPVDKGMTVYPGKFSNCQGEFTPEQQADFGNAMVLWNAEGEKVGALQLTGSSLRILSLPGDASALEKPHMSFDIQDSKNAVLYAKDGSSSIAGDFTANAPELCPRSFGTQIISGSVDLRGKSIKTVASQGTTCGPGIEISEYTGTATGTDPRTPATGIDPN